jgi:hypothetical protein
MAHLDLGRSRVCLYFHLSSIKAQGHTRCLNNMAQSYQHLFLLFAEKELRHVLNVLGSGSKLWSQCMVLVSMFSTHGFYTLPWFYITCSLYLTSLYVWTTKYLRYDPSCINRKLGLDSQIITSGAKWVSK